MAKLLEFIKRDNIIFWIFLLGLMLFISIKFGASTDEIHQQPYGNQSYKFFKTLGSNDSATYHRDDLINYYGALVDTIPEAINDVFSGNLFIYRHLIITLFSFL